MTSKFRMPPDGTSSGYRTNDGAMWQKGTKTFRKRKGAKKARTKPAILYCQFPGNLLNPSLYGLIATFEKVADRDLVLQLHKQLVVTDPAEKPFKVWIKWGADAYGNEPQLYDFATEGEVHAFLRGITESDGWDNWEQFDTEEEVQAWVKERKEQLEETQEET